MKRFYLTKEDYSLRSFWDWGTTYESLLKPTYISLTDISKCSEEDKKIKMRNDKIRKDFLKKSEKHFVRKIPHKDWYGHSYEAAEIYIYRYHENLFRLIESYTPYLLLSEPDGSSYLTFPQDINVFRENGKLLLGTVSHEGIADLFIEDDEVYKLVIPEEFCEGSYTWEITRLLYKCD